MILLALGEEQTTSLRKAQREPPAHSAGKLQNVRLSKRCLDRSELGSVFLSFPQWDARRAPVRLSSSNKNGSHLIELVHRYLTRLNSNFCVRFRFGGEAD